MRYGPVVLGLLAISDAVANTALWGQMHPPQQVRFVGRVYDEARLPIDRVDVIVNGRDARATTDGFGIFHVDLTATDSTVAFRRIGYRPLLASIRPLPPSTDTILVELLSSPLELPEVTVTGRPTKPLQYAGTTKYDDVFERRKIGLGVLIRRETIDTRPGVGHTYQLLEGLAGVHVYDPPVNRIRFTRCLPPGVITVWIDGVRQIPSRSGGDPTVEMLSRVDRADIEMIEVFRGPSEIPGVFQWDGCAAIAVWTRWNR